MSPTIAALLKGLAVAVAAVLGWLAIRPHLPKPKTPVLPLPTQIFEEPPPPPVTPPADFETGTAAAATTIAQGDAEIGAAKTDLQTAGTNAKKDKEKSDAEVAAGDNDRRNT